MSDHCLSFLKGATVTQRCAGGCCETSRAPATPRWLGSGSASPRKGGECDFLGEQLISAFRYDADRLDGHLAGEQFFRLEEPGASRWTTARALRVLRWWEEES
jgi:hypothetical protein